MLLGLLLLLVVNDILANEYTYTSQDSRIPLIIFGVDGYGYDAFINFGNKSSGDIDIFPIQTVFPSKTFPNFMSLATGLYPTQHGVISNKFYNTKRDTQFSYEDEQSEDFDWYKGEPIWITAKKRGLKSYVDMWVGSFAEYQGMKPDVVFKYNDTKTFQQKIDDLLENMDAIDGSSCDLYMLYINEPDYSLHRSDYSDTKGVQAIINKAEERIAYLKESLGDRQYNLIVTSDHGMAGYKRKYEISKTLRDKAKRFYGGVTSMWYSDSEGDSTVSEEAAELNSYLAENDMLGIKAREVKTLDSRFQLCGLEEVVPDIIFMMSDDVAVGVYSQMSGHGFDNTFPKMYGHVRVSGPAFKEVPEVEKKPVIMNTEMYNLFCSILGIQPANNTGSLDTFDFLLSNPPNRTAWSESYSQLPPPCSGSRSLAAGWLLLLSFVLVKLQG